MVYYCQSCSVCDIEVGYVCVWYNIMRRLCVCDMYIRRLCVCVCDICISRLCVCGIILCVGCGWVWYNITGKCPQWSAAVGPDQHSSQPTRTKGVPTTTEFCSLQ